MCDHATALRRAKRLVCSERDEDRPDRAAVVRGAADRLRRDRARRLAARRRPHRAGARRHPVRERRLRHQGDARVAARRPAGPRAAGQPVVRRLPRVGVLPRRSRDQFDVVHDHSGITGPAMGALLRGNPPVVHTLHGPWTELTRRYYALLHEHVHLVAISESQRADNPDVEYAGVVHNGIDLDDYPFRAEKDDFLVYIGRANPDKGPTIAIEVARRAGLPLAMVVKKNEPFERTYWDEIVAPLLNDEVEVYEAISHEQKADLLGRARAMVFPIQWPEPFGLVMAEAMACGTPVVSCPAGAAVELVENGVTGLPPRLDRRPRRRGGRHRRLLTGRLPTPGRGVLQRRRDGEGLRADLRVRRPRLVVAETPLPGFHYGGSANRMVGHGGRSPARDRRPPRHRRRLRDPPRPEPHGGRRRGPRPHGAQRLGEVDPRQHPARQPGLRGHRRRDPLPGRGHHRASPPTSGPPAASSWASSTRRRSPGSASSTSCARRWPSARASPTCRSSRSVCSSWTGPSAWAWTTASRSATSTRASRAARRSATRSCRWR